MRRIVVVGTSGSGKSTLARAIAQRLNLAHIELDALHWGPNWTSTPPDRLRSKVTRAIQNASQGWAVCGNYRVVRDAIWPHADTIIWLDYPMRIVFLRALRRTMKRAMTGEMLWGGCRENLWMQLCTKDSLFLWVINTWRIRRRDYPKMLRGKHCRHMRVIRFGNPKHAQQWLDAMSATAVMADSSRGGGCSA